MDIRSLPLLFVNWLIYAELSALLYSQVDFDNITACSVPDIGNVVQHRVLFRQCPNLQQFVKRFKVYKSYSTTVALLESSCPKDPGVVGQVDTPWPNIPELVACLREFEFLRELHIEVDTFEKAWRHNSILKLSHCTLNGLSLSTTYSSYLSSSSLGFLPLDSSVLGAGLKYVRMLMKRCDGTLRRHGKINPAENLFEIGS
jgi:hypothetical protein